MSTLSRPVTVVSLSDSGLVRQKWVFSIEGPRLLLSRYYHERRYSTTQEFKVVKFYDRLRDGEDYGDWQWLEESEVPWDETLQKQALGEFMSRIQVVRKGDLSS